MSKLRLAVLVFAIGFSGFALAQTSDPRGACKADYDKYCAGTAPGGGRIVACLNKQHDQLTVACKKALDNRKKP
jgi:Cysteine rich repeat